MPTDTFAAREMAFLMRVSGGRVVAVVGSSSRTEAMDLIRIAIIVLAAVLVLVVFTRGVGTVAHVRIPSR
jgi:hypothetical protein